MPRWQAQVAPNQTTPHDLLGIWDARNSRVWMPPAGSAPQAFAETGHSQRDFFYVFEPPRWQIAARQTVRHELNGPASSVPGNGKRPVKRTHMQPQRRKEPGVVSFPQDLAPTVSRLPQSRPHGLYLIADFREVAAWVHPKRDPVPGPAGKVLGGVAAPSGGREATEILKASEYPDRQDRVWNPAATGAAESWGGRPPARLPAW